MENIAAGSCEGREKETVVVHHVAGEDDLARAVGGRETFVLEVVHCRLCRREEDRREPVAYDAVDFLGHFHIKRAEAGFDVVDRDMEFGGGDGPREGAVGIAVEDDAVEGVGEEDFLDAGYHIGSLSAVGRRADGEAEFGEREVQFVEKHLRHIGVVVLAGVKDMFGNLVGAERSDGAAEGCGLDELGAGANDGEEVFHVDLNLN